VAFKHEQSATLHAALEAEQIHVMHQAGRIRIAVHGYNSQEDVSRLLSILESLRSGGVFF
jgi:selenocysteine lyase/cysteine desulfurase